MVGLVIVVALIGFALSGIRIAQEYERAVVFRLGRIQPERGPGLYYLIPILEWRRTMDLRVNTVNIEQQETITKDSVTIKVNAVLWFKVTDAVRAVTTVANFQSAVYAVALTSLRNVIGQHALDEVLKERDRINAQLKTMVDRATEPWGVEIVAVEMKDVEIPEQMQRAMAREAEATREKRARIIKAEAEHEAAQKLLEASELISQSPAALELRRLQMIAEVGIDQNTTTIIMLPSEFVDAARVLAARGRPPASSG
jgi:regulator of protease activity HflC (stomatin/prohibitin superfamily)